jgi:hypothetical protein
MLRREARQVWEWGRGEKLSQDLGISGTLFIFTPKNLSTHCLRFQGEFSPALGFQARSYNPAAVRVVI